MTFIFILGVCFGFEKFRLMTGQISWIDKLILLVRYIKLAVTKALLSDTSVQFVTTPATRSFPLDESALTIKSSTAVALNNFTFS